MANLIELYEKARLLNLQNLAHGKIDLNRETVSNIDYLDYILSVELELRSQAAIKRKGMPVGCRKGNLIRRG